MKREGLYTKSGRREEREDEREGERERKREGGHA